MDTTPDVFFSEDNESIAFSGTYLEQKGNEAAIVYVINANSCFDSSYELAKNRNELFTAITRSKAWVRVVGVGANMESLIKEFERVKQNDFKLNFIYPTEAQRKHMNIVNRDMSNAEKNRIYQSKRVMEQLVKGLENEDFYVEDLDVEIVEKIKKVITW